MSLKAPLISWILGCHKVKQSVRSIVITLLCTLYRLSMLYSLRFRFCIKTLLFEIKLSSKLHLTDLFKGYKLKKKNLIVILMSFA